MDHPTRHRHHSGMSDEDDDLHKELNYSVEINDGNFSWDLDKQDLCLKNINIAVPSGERIEYFINQLSIYGVIIYFCYVMGH